MPPRIEITVVETLSPHELQSLYSSVGWAAYLHDITELADAIRNSTYVLAAYDGDELVGLARGLSDDVSVFYLQDILVRPEYQHQGIGSDLLARCLERFDHVRQKVLLTDDLPAQHRFYEAMGYSDTRRIANLNLHAFVKIEGLELETS